MRSLKAALEFLVLALEDEVPGFLRRAVLRS